jgi:membrane protein DedA with SNARE-associated domain
MPIDRRRLAWRTSKWAIVGFTIKGTFTLSLMGYAAFTAWAGEPLSATEMLSHAVVLVAATALIGALCMTRYIRRKHAERTQAEPRRSDQR